MMKASSHTKVYKPGAKLRSLPLFVNILVLEHNYIYVLFMAAFASMAELSSCSGDHITPKSKIFTIAL